MAYATQTLIEAKLGARISAAFGELQSRYAKYRLYRKTLNELSDLSSRELNDLGLSYANLRSVAYESVYGG